LSGSRAADVLVDDGGERGLGHGADDALLLLAALEDEHGGDAADAVGGGHVGAVVRVHLAALDLAGVVLGQLVDHRRDHPARPAPRRPELHQHRRLARHHHPVPVLLVRHQHFVDGVLGLADVPRPPRGDAADGQRRGGGPLGRREAAADGEPVLAAGGGGVQRPRSEARLQGHRWRLTRRAERLW